MPLKAPPGAMTTILTRRLAVLQKGYGSRDEFVRACGIPAATLAEFEGGAVTPTFAVLEQIADGLGVLPWDLVHPGDASFNPVNPQGFTTTEIWDLTGMAAEIEEAGKKREARQEYRRKNPIRVERRYKADTGPTSHDLIREAAGSDAELEDWPRRQ